MWVALLWNWLSLVQLGVRGHVPPEKFLCILHVPKLVIINLKIYIFWIINQQPKFRAIFFSKINPDAHFGTKINTFTFYKGMGLGGNDPQKPKNVKKWRLYVFYIKYYIPDTKIYSVMMWIQIHAESVWQFFLIKMVQTSTIWVFPNTLFST